jgi:hypothetical protein
VTTRTGWSYRTVTRRFKLAMRLTVLQSAISGGWTARQDRVHLPAGRLQFARPLRRRLPRPPRVITATISAFPVVLSVADQSPRGLTPPPWVVLLHQRPVVHPVRVATNQADAYVI